jgi:hypothetical protein
MYLDRLGDEKNYGAKIVRCWWTRSVRWVGCAGQAAARMIRSGLVIFCTGVGANAPVWFCAQFAEVRQVSPVGWGACGLSTIG